VRALLDTCVVAEIRKPGGSSVVKANVNTLPSDALFLSVITIGEIAKGIALLPDGSKKRSLGGWLLGLPNLYKSRILPLDQETAEIWGELTAAGQKRGVTIPTADGLIAATALRHGLHVATRNTRHFEAAGAMVIDPWLTSAPSLQ
jgi:predicted nucleic acid-binding protein